MIPREKIEEVRERVSIVAVVSEYVQLTKRGRNHVGLCPFHSEKTPSFTVNEEKKLFHCFGCQESGNVITFIMRHEGMEFPEAVRTLARRYGITIVEEKREKGGPGAWELITGVNREAVDFFMKELKAPGGSNARSYLDERGFGGEIAERFRLGYAPVKWEGLTGYLKAKGFDLAVAEKAGLVSKKERGCYDRFRGRIIFPITDVRGNVVAFGGRSIDGGEPKYLNSPETAVFKKADTLFGLYQAKQNITKQGSALVVEGYFDLMALHRDGFINAVATMGTALTEGHITRLRGYAKSVYTLFDSDEAGKKAALRGLKMFLTEDVPSRVVLLPQGTDPDEFLKKSGPGSMQGLLKGAVPLMDFYLEDLATRFDLKTARGKAGYLDEVMGYMGMIKNVAERGHYAGKVATVLGIGVKAIYDVLNTESRPSDRASVIRSVIPAGSSKLIESTVLRVVLTHPELLSAEVLDALGSFRDPLLKRVAEAVAASSAGSSTNSSGECGFEPSDIVDSTEDEEVRSWIAGELVKQDDGFIESPEKMLADCVKKVLNAGKPREATRRLIERLEESGFKDVAMEIRTKLESS